VFCTKLGELRLLEKTNQLAAKSEGSA